MGVYKTNDKTKDGRCWFYNLRYTDLDGRRNNKNLKSF